MEKGRENVRHMGVPGKLQDFLDKEEAAAAGFKANRGVLYPVGIGPWGLAPGPVFWGQKINAAHGAVNMMMLMQSHEGVIRFFPVWEKGRLARFYRLRATARSWSRRVCQLTAQRRIESEKSRPCRVQNPWPGQTLRILDAATGAEIPHTADPTRNDYLTLKDRQAACLRSEQIRNPQVTS